MLTIVDTDTQALLRQSARDFIERECTPEYLNAIEQGTRSSAELWRQMADLGWTSLLVPAAYDGLESGVDEAATLCEEMGRGLVPGPFLSSAVLSAQIVAAHGSNEQCERLLPGIANGQVVTTFAFTEEVYGWVPGLVRLEATPTAAGFALRGVKQYIPDADVAQAIICAARTGPSAEQITLFLVDTAASGVDVRPMPGWTRQPLFEISFDGVELPQTAVIGEVDGGWAACSGPIDTATVLLCAYLHGAMERAYEMTMAYAHQRVQFGQPIARFQRVQDHLINMRNWTDAADLTTRDAVGAIMEGLPEVARSASLAKQVTSRGFLQLCDAAHHVHGGIGSDKSYGLHLYSQASRGYYHYLGSPEYHVERLATLLDF